MNATDAPSLTVNDRFEFNGQTWTITGSKGGRFQLRSADNRPMSIGYLQLHRWRDEGKIRMVEGQV